MQNIYMTTNIKYIVIFVSLHKHTLHTKYQVYCLQLTVFMSIRPHQYYFMCLEVPEGQPVNTLKEAERFTGTNVSDVPI